MTAQTYSRVSTDSILRNPTAPPFPTQTGIAPNCVDWMQAVAKDDYCAWFAGRAKMVPRYLYKYNAFLGENGENCPTKLWANYWYCVGTSSVSGLPANTGTLVTVTPTPSVKASATGAAKPAIPTTTSASTAAAAQQAQEPYKPFVTTNVVSSSISGGTTSATTLESSSRSSLSSMQATPIVPATAIPKIPSVPSSNANQPSSGPVVPPGAVYVGCASEAPGRALNKASMANPDMTIEMCLGFCSSKSLPLAGLEYSSECFCGIALPPDWTTYPGGANLETNAAKGACKMSCAGNKSQTCGGPSLLSVYRNTSIAEIKDPSTVQKVGTEFAYLGCFDESKGRVLQAAMMSDDTLTVDKCVGFCGGKGFKFVGVEYGRECWCGNDMRIEATKLEEARCSMACAGNREQSCGGPSALAVYGKGVGKRDRDNNVDHTDGDSALRVRAGGPFQEEAREEDGEIQEPPPVVTKTVRIMRRGRYIRRHQGHI